MHALKAPSFLWPSSRSASPALPSPAPASTLVPTPARPDSGMVAEPLPPMNRSSSKGPLNRLALASRKRPTTPNPPPTPTLVQDGSYLEALSLKLSEAVSKALSQPAGPPTPGEVYWNGKRALPKGRGSALGALIGSELEASASNSHLHRAILRSLHRPLSVLLTNLSAQLLPLVSSPQLTANPSPSLPNSVQLYAVAYATFAAELLESLDARGLFQVDNHGVNGTADNLRGIREGLESLIGRVFNPLANGIKNELLPLVEALEQNTSAPVLPASHPKQGPAYYKGAPVHSSIASLQALIPAHARNMMQYSTPPTMTSQTMLATVLISLIWRSLVALSHRPPISPSPSVSPLLIPAVPPTLRKKRIGGSTTPPNTPPSMRFSIKLPPSRPPSPPAVQACCPATDARALYSVFNVFPRPHENSRYALAREAVDEAFGGLAGLCALLDFEAAGDLDDLDGVTADLPTVIALPVLLRIFDPDGAWNVSSLFGVTDQEYREVCLSGFGRAEECGALVAKRVLDVLIARGDGKFERVVHWLEGRASLGD